MLSPQRVRVAPTALFALVAVVSALLLSGCVRKKPRTPAAKMPRVGTVETGIASWYGHPYHGRKTANGEVYDMETMTAAHRTLPFNVRVRVRNLANNKTVDVRINDRGPFVRGRIIDLSRAAARAIDLIGPGIAKVRVEVAALPSRSPSLESYAVQVGAFRERANADQMRRRMEQRFGPAQLVLREGAPPLWRVLVGNEQTVEQAAALAANIQAGGDDAFVVRLDAVSQ